MCDHNDQQEDSINHTDSNIFGPEHKVSSSLTESVRRNYVVVTDGDAPNNLTSMEPSVITPTVHPHSNAEKCSKARKLKSVCTEHQEAAMYLKEGNKNEPLCHHPSDAKSYWAYMTINHPAYYITEVIVCVLLLLLAFLEKPSLFDVPVQVAPSLELLFLLYISSDIILNFIWIKPKLIYKNLRTVIKSVLVVVMAVEAVVVLARGDPHFRATRALRPLFLMDTILLQNVRRILLQIFQSLGPIIDVLILFFFFISLFAVAGFYLFFECSSTNYEFGSFQESFIDLYVLATTANFPDIMMECYNRYDWTPIFFVIFLIILLYIINNILLAMVYSTFQDNLKENFKKLYLNRREAIRLAFCVLTTGEPKDRVLSLQNYLEMMKHYSPYTCHCN